MERRLIIAIAFSVLIIIAYPMLLARLFPEQFKKPAPTEQESGGLKESQNIPVPEPQPLPVKEITSNEVITNISTDEQTFEFSNLGGSIKSITLKKYKQNGKDAQYELSNIADPEDYIFALKLGGLDLSGAEFKAERTKGGIVYTYEVPGDMRISKIYNIPNDNYSIELQLKLENLSKDEKVLSYEIVAGSAIEAVTAEEARHIEASYLAGDKLSHINGGKLKKGEVAGDGKTAWVALKNKYFSIIMKPEEAAAGALIRPSNIDNILALLKIGQFKLAKGALLEERFTLYAGPSDFDNLAALNLEGSLNFGFFGWIGLFLLKVMKFLYRILHNWGFSIILLTLLINIVLYPLTIKSMKAMREMQALQPKIAALREECKNNPQKLNKEVMGLYKKHKVNPLGGCFPMLLQMPIFFALYQTLTRSVELKGARFLWIRDLSGPDAALKLPFSIPFMGSYLNILPLLMLLLMVVQQKLSSGSAYKDEQQKMMAIMMPIMFGVIFYNLPSGLVLYWVTNTAVMIGVQALLIKPQCTHPALANGK